MPPRLKHQSKTTTYFSELVQRKAQQLQHGAHQFFNSDMPPGVTNHIIFRWAFSLSDNYTQDDVTYFKIEMLDLTSCTTIFRIWEMNRDHLVHDDSYSEESELLFSELLYADWWQELTGRRLSEEHNQSLATSVQTGFKDSKIEYKKYIIPQAFCRLRAILGKLYSGIEYKIHMEIFDIKDKVQKLVWTVYCSKDFKVYQLVQSRHNADKLEDWSFNTKEKEQLALFGREEILRRDKPGETGDWIVDHNYLRKIIPTKQGCIIYMDISITHQEGRREVLSLTIVKEGRALELLTVSRIPSNDTVLDYLYTHGNKMYGWQPFSKRACNLQNIGTRKCVEAALLQHETPFEIINVESVESRVIWDLNAFKCLEYKIWAKLTNSQKETFNQEWIVHGNPFKDKLYRFVFATQIVNPFLNKTILFVNRDESPAKSRHIERSSSVISIRKHRTKTNPTSQSPNLTRFLSFVRSDIEETPPTSKTEYSPTRSSRKDDSPTKSPRKITIKLMRSRTVANLKTFANF